jgi:hypothetical protein
LLILIVLVIVIACRKNHDHGSWERKSVKFQGKGAAPRPITVKPSIKAAPGQIEVV